MGLLIVKLEFPFDMSFTESKFACTKNKKSNRRFLKFKKTPDCEISWKSH